ncbi:hypothetical protein K1T71_013012 [Dendrolimus kikuchii]|uniref:Uncharacterized protein n=1 Tax=Dendrolimus kikuchii TaxID=765133 RepID=A0ACC1CJ05_9NEOP|nr:hypothetical protein K1T71_013012 [Dendrolimus kikuchii]
MPVLHFRRRVSANSKALACSWRVGEEQEHLALKSSAAGDTEARVTTRPNRT